MLKFTVGVTFVGSVAMVVAVLMLLYCTVLSNRINTNVLYTITVQLVPVYVAINVAKSLFSEERRKSN